MLDKIVDKIYAFFSKDKSISTKGSFKNDSDFNSENNNNGYNPNAQYNNYNQSNQTNYNQNVQPNNNYNQNNQSYYNQGMQSNNSYNQNNQYNNYNQYHKQNMQYKHGMKKNSTDPGFTDYPFIYIRSKWFFPVIGTLIVLIIVFSCFSIFYIPDGDLKDIDSDFPDIIYTNEENIISATASGSGSLRNNEFFFSGNDNQVAEPEQQSGVQGGKIKTKIIAKIPGTFTLSAYSTLGNVKTNAISKRITVCNRLSNESLETTKIYLGLSDKYNLNLNLGDSNKCYEGITYEISDTRYATISDDGVLTAKAEGTINVTIKQGNDSAKFELITKGRTSTFNQLDLTDAGPVEMEKNKDYQINYKINDDSVNKTITYTSSDPSVATVSNKGVVHSKKVGQATITVALNGSGLSKTIEVNVVKNKINYIRSISLNETNIEMNKNTAKELVVNFTPNDATNKDIKWSSSNSNIAYVSATGVVTAYQQGTATITATSIDGEHTATCEITVK